MRIEVSHRLGAEAAKQRMADLVTGLQARSWPAGVEVAEVVTNWNDHQLDFSFVASRGFFAAAVSGMVTVTPSTVVVEGDIPGVVMMFLGEDTIRTGIEHELHRVLDA